MDAFAHSRDRRRSLWDKFWKDRDDHVVVWQTPNIWLIGWAVCTTISLFFGGHVGDVFFWIASVSLFVWSVLEIFRGDAYVRRLLGLVVLIYVIAAMIKSL